MADDLKTYQPKWDELKEHKHHRHHHRHTDIPDEKNRGFGGSIRMKDKQAYVGLMLIVLAVVIYGGYQLTKLVIREWRSLPMDDPKTEMTVDELNIRKVEKQEALLFGDSLAQTYNLDSTSIKRVQTDEHYHHVYRPPRKSSEWYITQREWKDIFRNMQRWRQGAKNDKKLEEKLQKQAKEQEADPEQGEGNEQ